MSREIYFSSKPRDKNYEAMYYYDSPFEKKYEKIEDYSFKIRRKSVYDIAVENGFNGTIEEWLESLHGNSSHIGENRNWFIEDKNTGIPEKNTDISRVTEEDIDTAFEESVEEENLQPNTLSFREIDNLFRD